MCFQSLFLRQGQAGGSVSHLPRVQVRLGFVLNKYRSAFGLTNLGTP